MVHPERVIVQISPSQPGVPCELSPTALRYSLYIMNNPFSYVLKNGTTCKPSFVKLTKYSFPVKLNFFFFCRTLVGKGWPNPCDPF